MVEYIGNIIRLDKSKNTIIANITDEAGNPINKGIALDFSGRVIEGKYNGKYWELQLDTEQLAEGKYSYRILKDGNPISFCENAYIVGCGND